jgi:hypothetical protein
MATGKRRQTFEKMNRERRVREKRALKAAKREQRKLEANGIPQDPALAGDEAVAAKPDESRADSV